MGTVQITLPERTHGQKISDALKEYYRTHEHHRKGKDPTEETRKRLSEANKGKRRSIESRMKISEVTKGENHPNWQGGISFEPYCSQFNFALKERIRNRDNRTCALCGKSEILNGRRLCVHHIDTDKLQGCDGKGWYLCALCISCNVKTDTPLKEFLIATNLPTALVGSGA